MGIVRGFLRQWRASTLVLACAIGVLVGLSGAGTALERVLREANWLLRDHRANANIQIVEIDAQSIAAIERWPWPRSNHARVVDQLRRAGAASIAFDVDFSSRSTPAEDAAFAAALKRAEGQVVLPTFRQLAGSGSDVWLDSLPLPQLREHSVLAAVSILPDGDGYIRRAPVGTMTAGVPRPSLSAMVAGVEGAAGEEFPIDFAINPNSIPRHSFIKIRDGRFDPRLIQGKNILIGATAVEMGDRYAVPLHGVLPGVVIQAMAAETLASGAPREIGWQAGLLIGLVLSASVLWQRSQAWFAAWAALTPLVVFGFSLAATISLDWYLPIVPALAALTIASAIAGAKRVAASARERRSHDHETGLPNRHGLRETFQGLHRAGLAAARIAEFEKLAAALGPVGTAELVRRICERIALVASDGIVYRTEDRVLCWRCDDIDGFERALAFLRSAMLHPVEVSARRVDVALAYGFASEAHDADCDRLVAHAALAADRASASGVISHVHEASENEAIDRELSLLGELDAALGTEEIQVLYQPKLDLHTDKITSVEALVRWHHATRGFLGPDLFVPLAERSDRIAGLTLHVLRQTITQLGVWQLAGHELTGAVNISAKLLSSPDFIADILKLVKESAIDPCRLIFEVTESATMNEPENAANALQRFRDIGIMVSIDDYGTGQSTLSYIRQLPLNELKIDRSFVQHAHQSRGDGVLVRSTVELAHELGLKVVAEGVEDKACLAFLISIGCDVAQGYLISHPVPAEEILLLLAKAHSYAA
jgi:diguanylate cyclase